MRGREIVSRLRGEGKIPAKVLNTFLEDLLERGTCICERHLGPGTPERMAVEQLLTIAGDQDFIHRAIAAAGGQSLDDYHQSRRAAKAARTQEA